MRLLKPNKFVKRFDEADVALLKSQGITLLICDIDNTLVAHDEVYPSEEAKSYIESLINNEIKVVFVSNNYEQRVKTFAEVFSLPYIAFAKKPLKKAYRKILKQYPNEKIACLGDQIMTDVIGGNRMKFYTIKTEPLVERDLTSTKLNRQLEKLLRKYWEE